jgi:hypothetical protein
MEIAFNTRSYKLGYTFNVRDIIKSNSRRGLGPPRPRAPMLQVRLLFWFTICILYYATLTTTRTRTLLHYHSHSRFLNNTRVWRLVRFL